MGTEDPAQAVKKALRLLPLDLGSEWLSPKDQQKYVGQNAHERSDYERRLKIYCEDRVRGRAREAHADGRLVAVDDVYALRLRLALSRRVRRIASPMNEECCDTSVIGVLDYADVGIVADEHDWHSDRGRAPIQDMDVELSERY